MSHTVEREIDAPIEQVWEALVSLDNLPWWVQLRESSAFTMGREGYAATVSGWMAGGTQRATVVRADPPTHRLVHVELPKWLSLWMRPR